MRAKQKHRRNRRKRVNGYASRAPLAVFLVMAGLILIGMLWVKAGSDALGSEIARLEGVSRELSERVLTEEMKWNRMNSVRNISGILSRSGVRMDWPASGQVVRMADASYSYAEESLDDADSENRYAGIGRTGRHE